MIHPRSGQRSPARIVALLLAAAATFAASMLLDRPILRALDWPEAQRQDWHRLFRVVGYLPTWALVALTCLLLSCRDAARRAAFLFLSPALAGLLAEALKLTLRRERPDPADIAYRFRPFTHDLFSTAGLGLPSSHAMVAFAGAAALCTVAPRAWPVWILLAAGCAFTRLADRAHYFSDITLAALAGVAVAVVLSRIIRPAPLGGRDA